MKIGELARRSGLSERMLRYYEQAGLLQPARTSTGYRDYGEQELLVARRIRQLSASGLKIETIRVLLPCMRADAGALFEACDEIHEALTRALAGLDAKLHALGASRTLIAGFLRDLDALHEPPGALPTPGAGSPGTRAG
ncbi:MerR family transcriptional regulator [Pseudomonas sp. Hp2]|uniref:MerR family transcriptional regulator n=1 Tax=Pseudomonas sp. Hp2 TaxID=701189 RepID=UPI00112635A9|nr:MerR family transcriptional regulator [Pseudomonas sp. Hp2]